MNVLLFVCTLFCPLFAQTQVLSPEEYIKEEQNTTQYKGSRNFTMKGRWYSYSPTAIGSEYDYDYFEGDFDEDLEDTIVVYSVNDVYKSAISEDDITLKRLEQKEKKQKIKISDIEPVKWPKLNIPKRKIENIDIDAPSDVSSTKNYIDIFAKFAKNIFVLLIISIMLWLIYKIVGKLKINNLKTNSIDYIEWNPNLLKKTEIELKLEQAELNENYREAIRIYYLLILKELIKQKLIYWQPEKTNHDYLYELRNTEHYYKFAQCVRIFDLVWYGEYYIAKDNYKSLSKVFKNCIEKLLTIPIENK